MMMDPPMLKNRNDLYRFTCVSQFANPGAVDLSIKLPLDFGPSATLDDGRRWMLAIESLAVNLNADPNPTQYFTIRMSGTMSNATSKSNYPAATNTREIVTCRGFYNTTINRNTLGVPITNVNFLNETIDIELKEPFQGRAPNDVASYALTFVVYAAAT
jgi:hypothetical protein